MKTGAERRALCLVLLLAVLAGLGPGSPVTVGAGARSTTVTTRTIVVDPIADDNSAGGCTLREAIDVANFGLSVGINGCTLTESGSGDPVNYVISLPGYTYALTGAAWDDHNWSGDLDVWANVTFQGAGVEETVIDGGNNDRVFHIDPDSIGGFTVSFSDVTIRNGWVGADGGGIYNGGDNTLNISGCTITGNDAAATGGADGGGIHLLDGILTVTDSLISGNQAASGPNHMAQGGGIYTQGSELTISGSTILSNTAYVSSGTSSMAYGGGIYANGVAVTLTGTTIAGNGATGPTGGEYYSAGGGICTLYGTLDITSGSSLTGNHARDKGGGLFGSNSTGITVSASTFSENAASLGGAIYSNWSNVTVSAGSVSNNKAVDGGGIYVEASQLTIADGCSLQDNEACGRGGGIYVDELGRATVDGSIISQNTADEGGGLFNEGTLTIQNKSLVGGTGVGNQASGDGGGIYNREGTVLLNDSSVSSNECGNDGGGIFCTGGTPESMVTLNGCTVSGNTTPGLGHTYGGGLYLFYCPADLTNTTLSGNTADYGGGIGSGSVDAAILNLLHCTIAHNTAHEDGGGLQLDSFFTVNISNTIVAANNAAEDGPDIVGTIHSQDYNLIEDTSGATILGTTTHNITGQTPLLGPLADNGGDTQTHALLAGSPAIDAIPVASCPLTTDQRGVSRPKGSGCDIGAYEADTRYVFLPLVFHH